MRTLPAALCLSLVWTAATAAPCPMADKSYTVKIQSWLSTKMYFNKDCTEVIQNFRGNITKHKLSPHELGWTFTQPSGDAYWIISRTGTSALLTTPEWRENFRMVPNRRK